MHTSDFVKDPGPGGGDRGDTLPLAVAQGRRGRGDTLGAEGDGWAPSETEVWI